ncbi:Bug family tripartite tricarboxylate transporter substrate binding protein [Cupriavidus numazuensis]|uniref:Tripartite tricarboxylate transporter substrate binding protein n=1 Tax=Cupriavidus numazuensis TaxID=221992 RepID=A0ABN7Q5V5_9BURK|nr:tripartite tricarboxylate transporter substrate binding protein [Cupriavidus numazuensis]CAG2158246.1 hypothetical protein LMG26411_05899 [Cupriavidus numazuensis]
MKKNITRRDFCGSLAATGLALAMPRAYAGKFPDRPIRVIVGYAPGGATDSIAREYAARLSKEIGQSVVIENKPGAGQIIAMQSALNSGSDGYTLVFGTPGSHSISPSLYKDLPYDPRKFVPISPVATQPNILVALPSFQASSFTELVKLAKGRKQPLNYGSIGIGSSAHLVMEIFKKRAGIDVQHIGYKGDAPALMALKSEEVELGMITPFTAAPRIRNGELKGIGVFQPKPDPEFPNVETAAHAGFPDIDLPSWMGVFAPPNTPKPVADYLEAASRRVVGSPEFKAFATGRANQPWTADTATFMSMIQNQSRQLGDIIKTLHLKPE